ncbi:hypothetical protein V7128_07685 [Neobacillus vireti]
MEKMKEKKAAPSKMAKMFENWKKNVVMDWGVVELTESVRGNKTQKN